MVVVEFIFRAPEIYLVVRGVRENVAIEGDVGIIQRGLYLRFQQVIQLYFGVLQSSQVAYTLGVDEEYRYCLMLTCIISVLPLPVAHQKASLPRSSSVKSLF